MSRRDARKHAFIIIYQIEFHKPFDFDDITKHYFEFLESFEDLEAEFELESPKTIDKDFIYTASSGAYQNLEKIDQLISENLSGWEMDRINKIDLAIMRLSIYEMLFSSDVPVGVSINEAVELAKIYGTDDSSNFINGLLGKVYKIIAEVGKGE